MVEKKDPLKQPRDGEKVPLESPLLAGESESPLLSDESEAPLLSDEAEALRIIGDGEEVEASAAFDPAVWMLLRHHLAPPEIEEAALDRIGGALFEGAYLQADAVIAQAKEAILLRSEALSQAQPSLAVMPQRAVVSEEKREEGFLGHLVAWCTGWLVAMRERPAWALGVMGLIALPYLASQSFLGVRGGREGAERGAVGVVGVTVKPKAWEGMRRQPWAAGEDPFVAAPSASQRLARVLEHYGEHRQEALLEDLSRFERRGGRSLSR
jgi:hypothetical protein